MGGQPADILVNTGVQISLIAERLVSPDYYLDETVAVKGLGGGEMGEQPMAWIQVTVGDLTFSDVAAAISAEYIRPADLLFSSSAMSKTTAKPATWRME